MIRLDERGKQCPLPVIEAKKALETASAGEQVEVIVDNEIAVQNLKKLGDYKGLAFSSQKKGRKRVCSGADCRREYQNGLSGDRRPAE